MKLLEKVLIATDFGEAAKDAAKTAAAVASIFGAKLILIHVVPDTGDSRFSLDEAKAEAQKRMLEIEKEVKGLGVESTDTLVSTGVPHERILQCADLHDVNLLVLGAKDNSEKRGIALGVTDARLICQMNKPVWVAKQAGSADPKKILCAIDFSETSARALRDATHLARKLGAELTVLNVIPALSSVYKGSLVLKVAKSGMSRDLYKKEQTENFEQFLKDFDFHNVSLQKEIREGTPAEEITAFALEKGFDLLVLGSVGKTGVSRILLGSVAEKVLQAMPCSVMAVKSEETVRLRIKETIADLQQSFEKAQALLENGFADQAIERFKHCIDDDLMFAPAYEGLAIAYQRKGDEQRAAEYAEQAKKIRDEIWQLKVRAEAMGQHTLFGKK